MSSSVSSVFAKKKKNAKKKPHTLNVKDVPGSDRHIDAPELTKVDTKPESNDGWVDEVAKKKKPVVIPASMTLADLGASEGTASASAPGASLGGGTASAASAAAAEAPAEGSGGSTAKPAKQDAKSFQWGAQKSSEPEKEEDAPEAAGTEDGGADDNAGASSAAPSGSGGVTRWVPRSRRGGLGDSQRTQRTPAAEEFPTLGAAVAAPTPGASSSAFSSSRPSLSSSSSSSSSSGGPGLWRPSARAAGTSWKPDLGRKTTTPGAGSEAPPPVPSAADPETSVKPPAPATTSSNADAAPPAQADEGDVLGTATKSNQPPPQPEPTTTETEKPPAGSVDLKAKFGAKKKKKKTVDEA